ncbi:MAG: hypothetical protein ACXWL2_02645 [Candidatus Chromulinivorax sp.]
MNKINFFVYILFIQIFSFLDASERQYSSSIWSYKVLHCPQDARHFLSQYPNDRSLISTVGELQWQKFFNGDFPKYLPISKVTSFGSKDYSTKEKKICKKRKFNHATIASMINKVESIEREFALTDSFFDISSDDDSDFEK